MGWHYYNIVYIVIGGFGVLFACIKQEAKGI
jgi:hypothetical protein